MIENRSPSREPSLPGRAPRSFLRIVLTLLLSVCLVLILTEAGLRFILGLGNPLLMQTDPAAGYVFKPNQHVHRFFRNTDINQYSMRAPSFSPAKLPGTYRVFFLGDSMTYGSTQVDQKAIFVSLLRAELPAQLHVPTEVLNASASAWAIANETGYLASRGTFSSDIVVLALNNGDGAQPPATISQVGGDAATVKPASAISELWTRYLRARMPHFAVKMDAGTAPVDPLAAVGPNLLRLDHFYQITQQQHARMALVYLAQRLYVPDHAQANAPEQLVNWCHQHQVPLLDTTRALSDLPVKEVSMDGIHYNARGHRLVATYLEQHWNELDPGRLSASAR